MVAHPSDFIDAKISETSTIELSTTEIRVLGCLLEKQRTTPDVYPLTLNALRLACNQATNREPVVTYDEETVREALRRLQRQGLARFTSGHGSRSSKYRHLLEEALPMAGDEQAVLCVLMLRGAQTPGEIKQRAERMHAFVDLEKVQETLERLIDRQLVQRLERRPGQKEERYIQLLGGGKDAEDDARQSESSHTASPLSTQAPGPNGSPSILAELQERVSRLEHELQSLRAELSG